jgi:hypothetical protein
VNASVNVEQVLKCRHLLYQACPDPAVLLVPASVAIPAHCVLIEVKHVVVVVIAGFLSHLDRFDTFVLHLVEDLVEVLAGGFKLSLVSH